MIPLSGKLETALRELSRWDDCVFALPSLMKPVVGLGSLDHRVRRALGWSELNRLARSIDEIEGAGEAPLGLALRGRIRRLLGDSGAARLLQRALRLDSSCFPARLWRAEILLYRRPRSALALLEDEDRPTARLFHGLALCRLGRWGRALPELQRACRLDPSGVLAPLAYGTALARSGDNRRALATYETAKANGLDVAALHWLKAISRDALGDAAGARRSVEEAFARHSESDPLDALLGPSRVDRARRDPRRSLAVASADASRPRLAWALANRSQTRSLPHVQDYAGAVEDLRRAVSLEPRSAWVRAYLGRALNNLGARQEAASCLDRAVRLAPRSGWIRAWRGESRRRWRLPGALSDLKRAVALSPEYALGRVWLAKGLRASGMPAAAAAELETALRLEPRYGWALAELFNVRREQGRWREACRLLTSAHEQDPKFSWAQGLGIPARQQALAELRRAVAQTPDEPELRAWRAKLLLEKGELRAAGAELESASPGATAFTHHVRAQWEERRGRAAEALRQHDRAVRLRPAGPYLGARGIFLYRTGRHRRAVSDLRRAVVLNDSTARFHYYLGAAYRALKSWDAASASLERASGICPDFAEGYRRADPGGPRSYDADGFRTGETPRVELNEILRADPGNAWALAGRGRAFAGEGRHALALADLRRARELDPKSAWIHFWEAEVLAGLGRWEEAAHSAGRALEIHGRLRQARVLRARIWRQLGRLVEAKGDLDEAIRVLKDRQTLLERAAVHSELGFSAEAAADVGEAIGLRGGDPELLSLCARYHLQTRDYSGALEYLDQAVAIRPRDPGLRAMRAEIHIGVDKLGPALADLEFALALAPEDAAIRLARLRVLLQRGDANAARAALAGLSRHGSRRIRSEADFYRGYLELKSGRTQAAQAAFQKVLKAWSSREALSLRARFYLAASCVVDASFRQGIETREVQTGVPKLYLCGLGIFPPYSATLEVLHALSRCDEVYNENAEPEVRELLGGFCPEIRAMAHAGEQDERRWADRIIKVLGEGKRVGVVLRGHPMDRGPLARRLVRRCRAKGIALDSLGSVSPVDRLLAYVGKGIAPGFDGVQVFDQSVLFHARSLNTRLPLLVCFRNGVADRRRVADFRRALERFYPARRACWMFGPRLDADPAVLPLQELESRYPGIPSNVILYIP